MVHPTFAARVFIPSDKHRDMTSSKRSARFFLGRWRELVEPQTSISRRARTLNARTAAAEALLLADSSVASGGFVSSTSDAKAAGHGVKQLPEVVEEALSLLTSDRVLTARQPPAACLLRDQVEKLRHTENHSVGSIAELRALLGRVEASFVEDAFEAARELIEEHPEKLGDLDAICGDLVTDLRTRGWSDETLLDWARSVDESMIGEALRMAASKFGQPAIELECFVPVALTPDYVPPTLTLVSELPSKPSGPPVAQGPYLKVSVKAHDTREAARSAHARIGAALGAASVFSATAPKVRGAVACVRESGALVSHQVEPPLPTERRSSTATEIAKILESTWVASETPAADPVFDALRLRHRAMEASDGESRLLLLWSGIERMTAGAGGQTTALAAARDATSKAVALGRVRRIVGDLAASLDHALRTSANKKTLASLVGEYEEGRIDREALLTRILGDVSDYRAIIALFYEEEPVLAQRMFQLRKALGAESKTQGPKIAAFHRDSQRRISWQVGRLYRARNRIAHIGAGPGRVHDLVQHAHFYLTQLVAICLHYRRNAPGLLPDEILSRRMGQYESFVKLLEKSDQHLMNPAALMRPTALFPM